MSPKPFVKPDQTDVRNTQPAQPREVEAFMRWAPIRNALTCLAVIVACIVGIAWAWTSRADAQVHPIKAPASLLRARAVCPDRNTTCLLGALRKAYAGIDWARKERTQRWAPTVELAIDLACTSQPSMDCNWFRRMIGCESHRDPFSQNSHSTAAGLAQFLDGTWSGNPYHRFSVYNPLANALGAAWLAARNGRGPWYASRGCWS